MPKLSITSLLFIIAYFAICSLNYVSENVTIGWLIVVATAIAIAVTTIHGFQTNDVFRLGFAVVGGVWLSMALGFTVETPASFKGYDLRTPIYKMMCFGRTFAGIDDNTNERRSRFHDLDHSIGMVRQSVRRDIPNWHNTMRLAACLSALIAGVIGGTCFSFLMKPNSHISEAKLKVHANGRRYVDET